MNCMCIEFFRDDMKIIIFPVLIQTFRFISCFIYAGTQSCRLEVLRKIIVLNFRKNLRKIYETKYSRMDKVQFVEDRC